MLVTAAQYLRRAYWDGNQTHTRFCVSVTASRRSTVFVAARVRVVDLRLGLDTTSAGSQELAIPTWEAYSKL